MWSCLAFLLAKLPPTAMLWEKNSTRQQTHHQIYANSSQPTLHTSYNTLYNADCGLAPTNAYSTFESVLVSGIRPTVCLTFSTHIPTAVGRLIGRCVLKIGRCVPNIPTLWLQCSFLHTNIGYPDISVKDSIVNSACTTYTTEDPTAIPSVENLHVLTIK